MRFKHVIEYEVPESNTSYTHKIVVKDYTNKQDIIPTILETFIDDELVEITAEVESIGVEEYE